MSAFFFDESDLKAVRVCGGLIELDLGAVSGGVFKPSGPEDIERMFDMTVRLLGVRSVTEDGVPCEGLPMRAQDGELFSFEIQDGRLEMVIQWHEYQPTRDSCHVYVIECERVELIPSLHPRPRPGVERREASERS
jgi:hypothetical protein